MQQHQEARAAHQQHAVLHGQPVAQRAEAVREPRVVRHVRHHPRPVDEAGLRRDEEQQRLRKQGEEDEPFSHRKPEQLHVSGELRRQQRVHGVVGVHVAHVEQQVAEDDAAGGHRQADGHVRHGALGGLDPGLAHDLQAVGDRFDSGVRAAAQRVGAHEEERQPAESERAHAVREPGRDLVRHLAGAPEVQADSRADDQRVRGEEGEKDGHQRGHRFLHATEIQQDQDEHSEELDVELQRHADDDQVGPACAVGQHAEDRVAAGGDGDGDGENVVDDQGRSAHHSGARTEEARGDHVSAAAEREVLDDAAVGRRDDQDGEGGRSREKDGQVGVLAEVLEGLFRPVRGRREPVGAQPHPGEKGDQRDVAEEVGILQVLGPAEQKPLEPLHRVRPGPGRRQGWCGLAHAAKASKHRAATVDGAANRIAMRNSPAKCNQPCLSVLHFAIRLPAGQGAPLRHDLCTVRHRGGRPELPRGPVRWDDGWVWRFR